jgi:hypothetical protein
VPGVGAITALDYVLTIEDPSRFAKNRSVGAYVGLRPRQRDSGEQRPQLRITTAGDRLLRSLLVRCAHYILGPFGPDTDLRRAGLRMAERGGSAAKKRAIVGDGASAGGAAAPAVGDGRGVRGAASGSDAGGLSDRQTDRQARMNPASG